MSAPTSPDPVPEPEAVEAPADVSAEVQEPEPAAVVEVELEKVLGLWPAVIDQVKQGGSELLSHVLAAARPVEVDAAEGVLTVGFPPSAAFNKRKAEGAEARERCGDAVLTVVGARLRPVYVLLDSEAEGTPVSGEAPLSEEELIDLVRNEFDAEEYVAEPNDGEAEAKEA